MILHFIRPTVLWLLIPALGYLAWIFKTRYLQNPWKEVCDPHLLPSLLEVKTDKSAYHYYLLLFSFYVISIFALAGPAWEKVELPVYREVSSLMLILDLSPSMNENDLKPNRLTRAKYKIRDLISTTQNTQMGLVAFTQEAFVASPLSQDANTLNALLEELSPEMMPVSGSDSGEGLAEGYKLLQQAGVNHGNLLLITSSDPTPNSFSTAKWIAKNGGHLNILAMLDRDSDRQTLANLQELAKTGGGIFQVFTPDNSDIQTIAKLTDAKQIITNENRENAYTWLDAGPWFCLLLIPFALLVLRETIRYEQI